MTGHRQCEFFLLRYVPDAVKDEFVNVGLVLLPATGPAEVRFTRDWSRVKCLDPQADLELMESIESDLREELNKSSADREVILRKIQGFVFQHAATLGIQGMPGGFGCERGRYARPVLPGTKLSPAPARDERTPGGFQPHARGL